MGTNVVSKLTVFLMIRFGLAFMNVDMVDYMKSAKSHLEMNPKIMRSISFY
jgi:hypothetical protein